MYHFVYTDHQNWIPHFYIINQGVFEDLDTDRLLHTTEKSVKIYIYSIYDLCDFHAKSSVNGYVIPAELNLQ